MRQLVLPKTWDGGSVCKIHGATARRLVLVLRLKVGDTFQAIDLGGSQYLCHIKEIGQGYVTAKVEASSCLDQDYLPDIRSGAKKPTQSTIVQKSLSAKPKINLAVGLLKGNKMDDVVRIAAESGVETIIPIITNRTIKINEAASRIERLQRIISEAISQSGSKTVTKITQALTLKDLCVQFSDKAHSKKLGIFFHEKPLANTSIHGYCSTGADDITVCIGPEGGFDDAEISELVNTGFKPAWLGNTVLKAESAAIYAIASLNVILLESDSWKMCSE